MVDVHDGDGAEVGGGEGVGALREEGGCGVRPFAEFGEFGLAFCEGGVRGWVGGVRVEVSGC